MGLKEEAASLLPSSTSSSPGPLCAEDDFWISPPHIRDTDHHLGTVHGVSAAAYLRPPPGRVLCSGSRTGSCCFRPLEHGGVGAAAAAAAGGGVGAEEKPLAGYRVVDAFGSDDDDDVRAFVLELQVRSSGRTRELQRGAGESHILEEELSTTTTTTTSSTVLLRGSRTSRHGTSSVSWSAEMMHWSMNTLPLPPYVELGVHSLSGLLWTLLLLFLWHCYRMGSDLPIPGHAHAGKLKSGSRRSMMSRGGSCAATKCSARSKLSRTDQIAPFISMETEDDEEQGQAYLTPVLSHALFPAQASAEAKKLYAALQEYAKRYSWVGMGRIHKGLREQVRLNDHSTIQKPHLFFLPDVPSVPFFPRDAHRHDIEVLEANYPVILSEFKAVYQRGIDSKLGWTSLGPKGQAVFPLYSAGVCVAGNCRSCPCTYRTLLSLRTFISSNSLGSAGFWLLGPGTTLGSSYGPTNTRLRCHLGLQTPPSCELVVGGEPQCWSEGHCLLVDDSFLHTVSHKGPSDAGPRVILSVDLWHPNVAAAERQALDFMFSPDC